MSRTFGTYHPYHPYDPYLHTIVNQTPRDLQITTWDKSKDGKDCKDHVVQNSWYNKSKILDHLSSSSQEGICS